MSRDTARRVLEIEAEAIRQLIPRLGESFDRALLLLTAPLFGRDAELAVLRELAGRTRRRQEGERPRLSLHSRTVLVATLFFIAVPAGLFLFQESAAGLRGLPAGPVRVHCSYWENDSRGEEWYSGASGPIRSEASSV